MTLILYGAVFHFIGLLISRCEVLVEVVAEAMCVSGDIFKVCYVRLSLNCVVCAEVEVRV